MDNSRGRLVEIWQSAISEEHHWRVPYMVEQLTDEQVEDAFPPVPIETNIMRLNQNAEAWAFLHDNLKWYFVDWCYAQVETGPGHRS